jgi:hypothetical protein
LWKSNLNDITGYHASENYEGNMGGKYCRIYPEFEPKKTPTTMGILGEQLNTGADPAQHLC